MSALDLRHLARALGGQVQGQQVLAPGPRHSRGDHSLSVRLSPAAQDGFTVKTFSPKDDWRDCRDYVRACLGLAPWQPSRVADMARPRPAPPIVSRELRPAPDNVGRIARAVAIWRDGRDPAGTIVERYLASRGLALPEAGPAVLRFHPRCPWRDDATGEVIRVPAMVAPMRSIVDDTITAVHKTWLTPEGVKVTRKMQGPSGGAAIKVDDHADVAQGIVVGEGLETVLTGRLFGLRPAWALGSAGGISALPLLPGVDGITILGEAGEANANAVQDCADRWLGAGRDVILIEPTRGSDINDALQEVRRG